MWAHLDRRPAGKRAVVHLETIVVLEHGNDISRSGVLEESRPRDRVELLGPKHRNEVLVAEFVLRPVSSNMVLVFFRALDVHLARIPLAAECRHRIYSPV